MDSNETDNNKEILSMRREKLLLLQRKVETAYSELKASGLSDSKLHELLKLSKELEQKLLNTTTKNVQDPSKELPHIHNDLDKVIVAVEVGHSCDLCQRDLARDPERPNASLCSFQEACVLSCGHVYHFKCLRGTTLDVDNHSTDPSCIFCISSEN